MTEEMLNKFCAKSDERDYLMSPTRRNGSLYASNGHLLVCIPDNPEIKANSSKKPNFERFESKISDKEYAPLIVPEMPEPKKCRYCRNGRVNKCGNCEGEGHFNHNGHEYDCKECDCMGHIKPSKGDGLIECDCCGGTGLVREDIITVGHQTFQPKYISLIAELPNVRIWTDKENRLGCARFLFDGGWGVLMPCSP